MRPGVSAASRRPDLCGLGAQPLDLVRGGERLVALVERLRLGLERLEASAPGVGVDLALGRLGGLAAAPPPFPARPRPPPLLRLALLLGGVPLGLRAPRRLRALL